MTQPNNGATIILIHGWALGSVVWAPFIERLPHDWQIHTIDLPGYGSLLNGSNVGTEVDAIVEQLIDQIPIGAILIGWSLGGMVAIKLAQRLAGAIRGLVLLASTPCFVKMPDWPHGMEGALIENMAANLSRDKDGTLEAFVTEISLGDPSPRKTIRSLRKATEDKHLSLDTLQAGLQILANVDLRPCLGSLTCPLGMVLGRNDRLIGVSSGQAAQALRSQTQIFIIENAGHAPFISQQEKTFQAINTFVEILQ